MIVEEIDPSLPEDFYKKRLEASRIFAENLFHYPENVTKTCAYWISQYGNYAKARKEEEFFNDTIESLLTRPPALRIYASEGMERNGCSSLTYRSLIHFVGSEAHTIPVALFSESLADFLDSELFPVMGFLMENEQKCFIHRTPMCPSGEMEFGVFVFDSVLAQYQEPYFMILTLFKIHLAALIGLTGGKELTDWLPRHQYSLRAINEESLQKIACFPPFSPNAKKKEEALRRDLRSLYDMLNTSDLERARELMSLEWKREAERCFHLEMMEEEEEC